MEPPQAKPFRNSRSGWRCYLTWERAYAGPSAPRMRLLPISPNSAVPAQPSRHATLITRSQASHSLPGLWPDFRARRSVLRVVRYPSSLQVTNESYGDRLSASGTIIVWGTGFFAGGGNAIVFASPASADPITLNATSGSYFWDLSPDQINATIAAE
jgi:hypothetical protein